MDKNGLLPPSRMVAQLLRFRPYHHELPVGTTGDQGDGLRDDTHDADGIRSRLHLSSAQLGRHCGMDGGHRHSGRFPGGPGTDGFAQDAGLHYSGRSGLHGGRSMVGQHGRPGGCHLPPHRRRLHDPGCLSLRRDRICENRQARNHCHTRVVHQNASDHGRIGCGRPFTDRDPSNGRIFQQVVSDPRGHCLRPLGVCDRIAHLQFGHGRPLLPGVRVRPVRGQTGGGSW